MNVEIGTEAPIFLFWKYLFRNFGVLSLQCGGEGLGGRGMICIAMEALGGAQPCCCHLPAASICTQAIVITQIKHGVQGQYSTVPIPSSRLLYKHLVYYPSKYGQTFPLVDNQILITIRSRIHELTISLRILGNNLESTLEKSI
jgi:hypothetical protein